MQSCSARKVALWCCAVAFHAGSDFLVQWNKSCVGGLGQSARIVCFICGRRRQSKDLVFEFGGVKENGFCVLPANSGTPAQRHVMNKSTTRNPSTESSKPTPNVIFKKTLLAQPAFGSSAFASAFRASGLKPCSEPVYFGSISGCGTVRTWNTRSKCKGTLRVLHELDVFAT